MFSLTWNTYPGSQHFAAQNQIAMFCYVIPCIARHSSALRHYLNHYLGKMNECGNEFNYKTNKLSDGRKTIFNFNQKIIVSKKGKYSNILKSFQICMTCFFHETINVLCSFPAYERMATSYILQKQTISFCFAKKVPFCHSY